jgi:1-aminocyclopropane-1-carboxylate deaminase/D-cysteine desulfhydrase-like pyridoxal-dependent ACC family enzyme
MILNILDINDRCSLLGASGYINKLEELEEQLKTQKVNANYLVLPSGTGGTYAGLILGVKALKLPMKVIGIAVSGPATKGISNVVNNANATAKFLGLDLYVNPEEVTL